MSIKQNEMSNFGLDIEAEEKTKHTMRSSSIMYDVGGDAQLAVDETSLVMMNKSNGLNINEFGTCISGAISIGRTPGDIRTGGFWVLNDKLLTGLPSTTYTPIPVLVYKEPPAIKYVQRLASTLSSIS